MTQQPQFLECVGIGQQRVDVGDDLRRGRQRIRGDHPAQGQQRGVRLQSVRPLGELLVDDLAQRHQAAAFEKLVGQRDRVGDPGLQHDHRDPDAEHAEPVQQRAAGGRIQWQRAVVADEPVGGQHRLGQFGGVDIGQFAQRGELVVAQRARSEREQPGHRYHRLADAGLVHLGGEPGGDLVGGQHRVDPPGPDLVGAGGHPDDAERAARAAHEHADLFEQRDVGGVEGAQQEHHGVDAGHAVVGNQQAQRALGDVGGQRRGARGVDDGGVDQGAGRPLDVEVDHLGRVEIGQIERQATLAHDGDVAPPAAAFVRGDPRGGPVPEPRDDAGRLCRVGGRDVLPHQRIDQGGFAGFQRSSQRDADRLVQPPADAVQFVVYIGTLPVGRVGLVGPYDPGQDGANLVARAHRPGVSSAQWSRTWRRMLN